MIWMWGSSRGGAWMGMGGMIIGLLFMCLLLSPSVSMRGFLPFLLIFFGPALFALIARRNAPAQAPVYEREPAGYPLEKPKRGESLAEMVSLLSDEELDDLRRRVKSRLAEDIDNAGPDEVATFEELLDREKDKRS